MSETVRLYGINRLRETLVVREETRRSMQGNRGTETKPERTLRRALWAAGARGYRKNVRKLPGTPDVVFGRQKVAVFLHGCFWHGCPSCQRDRSPAQNRAFWQAKVANNQARHARAVSSLSDLGYAVVTVWECQLQKSLDQVVGLVLSLRDRPQTGPKSSR
ncbi:MAG: very short patch repair endonuclease [Fimbriimonadaceae bacterium]|nr:very short patch repair endonuclease [Fimbriimonadaceae bacterium]QYK56200.1 MAG: very short patch repair endonuclease [Fimbriimonadaceae bacterium]